MLSYQIESFLRTAKEKDQPLEGILALIVPHAGYPYSGQVAAHAYHLIQGKNYETVVIIGPSHFHLFRGCSIYPGGGYETPLGVVEIDERLASEISKNSGFKFIPEAHQKEHSVEVQIPFIQKILPQAKIVPIIMGIPTKKTITSLAEALSKSLPNKNALVVASTDMSHYLSKEEARVTDGETMSLIKSIQTTPLLMQIQRGANIMCGGGPVISTLLYAKQRGNPQVKLLNYADSSATGGPESQVVGYLAAAVFQDSENPDFSLSLSEKNELLQIASSAIELFIKEKNTLSYQPQNSGLLAKKGAFVTLRKNSRLRGCIGFIEPVMPLYQAVIQAAVFAASQDDRFLPVTSTELPALDIEISVLSPLKKIQDLSLIKIGKHGLLISKGNKKGLLLPQVPVENHWSRTTFLQQACLKAGLPENAWKSGAEIYIFEAIIFQ